MSPTVRSLLLAPFLLVALALGLPAAAGSGGGPFPVPVMAPVLVGDDVVPELAVSSYGLSADGETLEVRFAEPFAVPEAVRYRVELHVGDPAGPERQVSYVLEDGESAGVVEERDGDDWNEIGGVDAELTDEGRLDLEVPGDLLDGLETTDEPEGDDEPDGDDAGGEAPEPVLLAWIEVELMREEGGEVEQLLTPLVPALDLLGEPDAVLQPAPLAWGSTEQPPDLAVATGAAPTVRIEDDELIVEYSEPVPTQVDGDQVTAVRDVVRIAPDFGGGGAAPYLMVIDHDLDAVNLLDGNLALPAEVPNDGSWLLEGLPTRSVGEGDVIRASLPDVLEVFEISSDDPASDDQLALGLARVVVVADPADPTGSGVSYSADGVIATSAWLSAAPATGEPETTTPAGEVPTTGTTNETDRGDDRSRWFAPAVTACVIALLATAAFLISRWIEHRRRVAAAGPVTPVRPPPEPTAEEREELDEFTREIFGR
jgi:hypothetical protein